MNNPEITNLKLYFVHHGEYPQIDGETFKICPKCFKILQGVIQQIEDIFDGNTQE